MRKIALTFGVVMLLLAVAVYAQSVYITPNSPTTDDDLTCVRGTSVQYWFRWYVNDFDNPVMAGSGTQGFNVLPSSYTRTGDDVQCQATTSSAGIGERSNIVTIGGGGSSNQNPTSFTYVSPAFDAEDVPTSGASFSWNPSTDPEGKSVTYDIYLWKSGDSKPSVPTSSSLSSAQWTASQTLESGILYFWQVVARDPDGGITYGDIWMFTTEGGSGTDGQDPPTVTISVSPSRSQYYVSDTITFKANVNDPGAPAGVSYEYHFDMGDGTIYPWISSDHVTHQYDTSGYRYVVEVTVKKIWTDTEGTHELTSLPATMNIDVVNAPPVLTGYGVQPQTEGDVDDTYVFSVTYSDTDNDQPLKRDIIIDSLRYPLPLVGGDYSQGVEFTYSTSLSEGTHNYYFEFSDGNGHTAVSPTYSVTVGGVSPSDLNTNLGNYNFGTVAQGDPVTSSYGFNVWNSGEGTISWISYSDRSWLNVESNSQTGTVTVTIPSTSGLSSGLNEGWVYVKNMDDPTEIYSGKMSVFISETSEEEPVLEADPNHDFGTLEEGVVRSWVFTVRNSGTGTLYWDISTGSFPSWVSVSPTGGTEDEGMSRSVTVSVDTSGLTGYNSAAIAVNSNGGTASGIVSFDISEGPESSPVIDSIGITPVYPDASDTLKCTSTVSDSDGDLDYVRFKWYVNGASVRTNVKYISGGSSTQFDELSPRNSGDHVTCEVAVRDKNSMTDTDSVSVDVGQGPGDDLPHVTSVSISPSSPKSGDNLVSTAWFSDSDGDLSKAVFYWYVNGVLRATSPEYSLSGNQDSAQSTLPSLETNQGDVVQCAVKVWDSADNHDEDSDYVTVSSHGTYAPPISVDVEITPRHPNTQQDLTCRFSGSDMDDNLDYVIFEWYIDGLKVRTVTKNLNGGYDQETDVLNSGYTYHGDEVECKCTVYDTTSLSDAGWSDIIYIGTGGDGHIPVARLRADDNYVNEYQYVYFHGDESYDPDGYIRQYKFDYGDGRETSWMDDDHVYHSYSDDGIYHARLKVRDNEGYESDWSPSVTVYVGDYYDGENMINSIRINPSSPKTWDNLECEVDLYDEYGELDRVEFKWYVNSVMKKSTTKYISGYSRQESYDLPSGYTSDGDNVRCYVKVWDSDGNYDTAQESVIIGGYTPPSYCDLDITDIRSPSQVREGTNSWVEVTVKNTGRVSSRMEINVYSDGSFEKRSVVTNLAPGASVKRMIEFPLPAGEHTIRIEASLNCGKTVNRYRDIKVYSYDGPGPLPPADPENTYAKVLHTFIDIPYMTGKSFPIVINSPEERTFDISVEGVPRMWLNYPSNSTVEGRKLVYVYVNPEELGTYSMNVKVSAPGFEYSKRLSLYVVPEGESFRPGGGSMTGMFTGTASALFFGIAVVIVAIVVILIHYGHLHLHHAEETPKTADEEYAWERRYM